MMIDIDSSAAGTDNRPPIPTPHPQTTEPTLEGGAVPPSRNKRDEEFTEEDNRNELADNQAINILIQGLPRLTQLDIPTRTPSLPTTFLRIGIANLLSGLQKQFPPTNNQLRTTSNPKTHATVHDGQIVTEMVQRRAPGNTGTKGIQTTGSGVNNSRKKVIFYNCHGEGHVARQCKEPKHAPPYDQPLALTTTNLFEANHEDAYDFDVDEGPHASTVFMTNISSIGGTNGSSSSYINEVQINDDSFFSDVSYPLAQEMQQEEHLNSEVDSMLDDNIITYDEYQNNSEVVPTVVSADEADKQSMIAVLQRMHTEIAGYVRVNDEHKLVNATLTAELEWGKIEMQALEYNKKELYREQVYWLPAAEIASQSSTPAEHVAPFVHTRPIKSDVHKKALETELTQLKDTVTSLKIQNDGYKIAAQKAEIATLNAKTVGNKTSATTKPANPKIIALGMYAIIPKYIVPQRRTNKETPIPLPKKKQVTFQETPKPSPRFTKQPVAPLLKKPNVNVPLSTGTKYATEASKPASKSNAWIYRKLPAKTAKGEKVEEHIRNLNKNNRVDSHVKRSVLVKNLNAVFGACHECLISFNHDNCLVYSVKSVNRKQPKAKNTMRTTKKVWRPKGWKAGSKGIPAMFE
nr:hypothetical protein [Tanacetum cinerariifolium]